MDTDTKPLQKTSSSPGGCTKRRPKSVLIRVHPWFYRFVQISNCGIQVQK
jgi:hypothetical protein